MVVVPLQPLPNQTLQAQINNQPCTISVFQFNYGLFFSLFVGSTPIVLSVICRNLNRLVRDLYLGFSGDFIFVDTQGSDDPDYLGLGGPTARYQLVYLSPDNLGGEG